MLGSINKFILKYPGLAGTPFYFFLFAAIGTAGGVFAGVELFYTNVFNAATVGLPEGLGVTYDSIVDLFNDAGGYEEQVASLYSQPNLELALV